MSYRYEDLGDERFQQLCQALLAAAIPGVQCFPVGQPDGGRDAVRRPAGSGGRIVHQVKWTRDARIHEDPVAWVEQTVRKESTNLRRLVAEGISQYVLMTNVPATAHPGGGRHDRVERRLDELSEEFGVPMSCWWRDELDRHLDSAPWSLKLEYSEVLVGSAAIVAAIQGVAGSDRLRRVQRIVHDIAAGQWDEDATVRFKQAGMDVASLTDLFIDVPGRARGRGIFDPSNVNKQATGRFLADGEAFELAEGGAAAMLLNRAPRRVVVFGAPGQGKSTLLQFVCQVHRARLLNKPALHAVEDDDVVLPIRLDLRDFAQWQAGEDPFDATQPRSGERRGRRAKTRARSLEQFLARWMVQATGGSKVTVDDVKDICDRYPVLLALDGLDEVADPTARQLVVDQIHKTTSRLDGGNCKPRIIITTRPSHAELAEPDLYVYHALDLIELGDDLKIEYLKNWSRIQGLRGRESRDLQRLFQQRSAEPHVRDLSNNPMQLAILLYLIYQRGESIPAQRTELYRDYLRLFMDREAAKSADVAANRTLLEDVTSYVGWYLQSSAEEDSANGRASLLALKKVMRRYLADAEQDTTLVDTLFTAMTDRVWVLVSRTQGTFEFEVQPIREYFAARHIADTAPLSASRRPDKAQRFLEVAKRPYWHNTARFLAGFFTPGELQELADVLDQLHDELSADVLPHSVARSLLEDGTFIAKPRAQAKAVKTLLRGLGERIYLHDVVDGSASMLSPDRGGRSVVAQAKQDLLDHPEHPLALERARFLGSQTGEEDKHTGWLRQRLEALPKAERTRWLRLGVPLHAASEFGTPILDKLIQDEPDQSLETAAILLAAAAKPAPTSEASKAMLQAVLAGRSSELGAGYPSPAADLLHTVLPAVQLARIADDRGITKELSLFGLSPLVAERTREAAIGRLRSRWPQLLEALRYKAGAAGDDVGLG